VLADIWTLAAYVSTAFQILLTLVHTGDTMLHCQPVKWQIYTETFITGFYPWVGFCQTSFVMKIFRSHYILNSLKPDYDGMPWDLSIFLFQAGFHLTHLFTSR
jgi:hypothetical protein